MKHHQFTQWSKLKTALKLYCALSAISVSNMCVAIETNERAWGCCGPDSSCVSSAALQQIIDDYYNAPNALIPGVSVAIISSTCGKFVYSTGFKDIQNGIALQPTDKHCLASDTKLLLTAITLKLNEEGYFPQGLDTKISDLLSPSTMAQLTNPFGVAPPPPWLFLARPSGNGPYPETTVPPAFSQITLKFLMNTNHGMYDYDNEVFFQAGFQGTQTNNVLYTDRFPLYQILQQVGYTDSLITAPPAGTPTTLSLYATVSGGYKCNPGFIIGNLTATPPPVVSSTATEREGGNTGFSILAILLEEVTNLSLEDLLVKYIQTPLNLSAKITFVNQANIDDPDLARGYQISNPNSPFDLTYSAGGFTTDFKGFRATDVYRAFSNGIPEWHQLRGDGGAAMSASDYVDFLQAFYYGDALFSPASRALLFSETIEIPHSPLSSLMFGDQQHYLFALGVEILTETDSNTGIVETEKMHGGTTYGTRCRNAVETLSNLPDTDYIVIQVCQNATPYGISTPGVANGSMAPGPGNSVNPASLRNQLINAIRGINSHKKN